jgi:hypothetical protein
MMEKQSLRGRWEDYQPSKTVMFWACAACVIATLVIGFTWGGWVTGGTAGRMAAQAVADTRADLGAAICVSRFEAGSDAVANLAALKASDSWKRSDYIEKGGWTTLAGTEQPIAGAADLCAERLIAMPPATKVSG